MGWPLLRELASWRALAVALLLGAALPATASLAADDPTPSPLPGGLPKFPPGLPALPEGSAWQEVRLTGGRALCSRGTPYGIFVHEGDPDKLIINFGGGGACFSADSCGADKATFFPDLGIMRLLLSSDLGVFSESRADNPFKGWTHILVPNCTGDLNIGDSDYVYKREDGTSFKVYHRGGPNSKAALAWIAQRYQKAKTTPSRVVVTGASAGAYASIVWTPSVKEMFPAAVVRQFGDSGAGIADPLASTPAFPPQWNVTASLPSWVPGLDPATDDLSHIDTDEIYLREAQYYPDIEFTQFNYSRDQIQAYFWFKNGGDLITWTPRLYAAMAYLKLQVPDNFHHYLAKGDGHAITVGKDLYETTTNGESFRKWLNDYIVGQPPHDQVTTDP